MITRILTVRSSVALAALSAFALAGAPTVRAQNNGTSLELHANENVAASSIGLPHFPTSHPYKGESKDSAADVGFTFGKIHFRVMTSRYETNASADQVMDFYRKALARYGDVLECEHGRPVGALKATKEGLTCEDSHGSHSKVNADYDSGRQLRSGTPEKFRVVALESSDSDDTHFTLVYLEMPKDDDSH
jgi:hypothetical protein